MEKPPKREHANNDQWQNISSLYNTIASAYDEQFEAKAEYNIPEFLHQIYQKHNIKNGVVLDIGCGTGKLKEYLGDNFTYRGIDISPAMTGEAEKCGFDVFLGPSEKIIRRFDSKSVDHITALSSLYFIKDYKEMIAEFERVARHSIFVSLEQFTPELTNIMREKGIDIYSHSASAIKHPTEQISNVHLWKRPTTNEKVFGDLVFKKLA